MNPVAVIVINRTIIAIFFIRTSINNLDGGYRPKVVPEIAAIQGWEWNSNLCSYVERGSGDWTDFDFDGLRSASDIPAVGSSRPLCDRMWLAVLLSVSCFPSSTFVRLVGVDLSNGGTRCGIRCGGER